MLTFIFGKTACTRLDTMKAKRKLYKPKKPKKTKNNTYAKISNNVTDFDFDQEI